MTAGITLKPMAKGGAPTISEADADRVRVVMRSLLTSERGYTVTSLAKALDVAQPSLSQILSGKTKPSVKTAVQLSLEAGVRLSALLPDLFGPLALHVPKKYPSKAGAVLAALEVELPAEAIRLMLTDDPDHLDRDPGPRWWLRRADLFADQLAAASAENRRVPRLPEARPKALPEGKRRKRARSH